MPLSPSGLLDALILPPPDDRKVAFLRAQPFAHRGLHGGTVVENSPSAFAAAIARQHGFELDVQESADHEALVFHDARLDRLTGETGALRDRTGDALTAIHLSGTDECIPRLADVLAMTQGRVPILIEIKSDGPRVAPLCLAVRRALEGYRGKAAIMSFNPMVCRWFHDHAPRIVRGLVVTERDSANRKLGLMSHVKRRIAFWSAKPDFLAYDIRDLPSRFVTNQRTRGFPVVTWTVRTAEQRAVASAHADQPIYEEMGVHQE